ncbi:MAG: hypothetical protein ACYC4Q_09835 [Victivallaceae bacterium]
MNTKEIPQGLVKCNKCGEYKGEVAGDKGEGRIIVSCLCDGIFCPVCGINIIHRPISNYYNVEAGIVHVPVFGGQSGCEECQKRLCPTELMNSAVLHKDTDSIYCPKCEKDFKIKDLIKEFPNRASHDMPPGWLCSIGAETLRN